MECITKASIKLNVKDIMEATDKKLEIEKAMKRTSPIEFKISGDKLKGASFEAEKEGE